MSFWKSRKRKDIELDAEIQNHLELSIREKIERGPALSAAQMITRLEQRHLMTLLVHPVCEQQAAEAAAGDDRIHQFTVAILPC